MPYWYCTKETTNGNGYKYFVPRRTGSICFAGLEILPGFNLQSDVKYSLLPLSTAFLQKRKLPILSVTVDVFLQHIS